MTLFPTKELSFKLIDSQEETLERLRRRTEYSKNLTSAYTERSFRGRIDGFDFRIISSTVGRGAFCVLTGSIDQNSGFVHVHIHKVFKVLLGIILLFPFLALIIIALTPSEQFSPTLILVAIGQVLMIRYVFIGLAFKYISRDSLSRLRDVLDVEYVN